MADAPEVVEAKKKLKGLVGPAVDKLEELMESEHAGIRLGAAKEVLDRGGVPARQETHVAIDVGIDEEIEELIRLVRRQVDSQKEAAQYLQSDIEDAELVEEIAQLSPGEQAGKLIGVPKDDITEEAEEVPEPEAWWQANAG